MHRLTINPDKPNIAEVRALVREEGSSLLESATDEQIDNAITRDIGRPAVTATLLAGAAANWCEFDVLVDRLRGAVADGSVLDYEPADGKPWRAFLTAKRPPQTHGELMANAAAVGDKQEFLARRLVTAATEMVKDAGADFDAKGRGLAVSAALFAIIAAPRVTAAKAVLDALPADEWEALIGARRACIDAYRRDQAATEQA